MAAFHPRLQDLPTEFPVFPLEGALLLPRGRLPLNIFEPRYLALVEDALAAGRMFGMIQPDPARAAGPQGPACYRVGCLGRLSSFTETDDGRYLITLTGLIRFQSESELPPRRGYRRFRGEFADYRDDLRLDPQESAIDRDTLLTTLRGYFVHRGF
ncbi:MAG: LON peptidase substrate-binding domain-containing protein [Acetobacteraceae bacterium]